LPLLASVAAFLCLILDHLLCPDMNSPLYSIEATSIERYMLLVIGLEISDNGIYTAFKK